MDHLLEVSLYLQFMLKQHISLVLVYVVLGPHPASPWQEKKKRYETCLQMRTLTQNLLLHLVRQRKNGCKVPGFLDSKPYKHSHSQYGT